MTKISLWEEVPKVENNKHKNNIIKENKSKKKDTVNLEDKYVVFAGINKTTGRQLYLSSYTDSDDFSISVVPFIMDRKKALKTIEKAKDFIEKNPKRYKYIPINFVLKTIENKEIFDIVKYLL